MLTSGYTVTTCSCQLHQEFYSKEQNGFSFIGLIATYRYRLNEEKAEWIIYVTDIGQQQHFDMVFSVRTQSDTLLYCSARGKK